MQTVKFRDITPRITAQGPTENFEIGFRPKASQHKVRFGVEAPEPPYILGKRRVGGGRHNPSDANLSKQPSLISRRRLDCAWYLGSATRYTSPPPPSGALSADEAQDCR